ncbi:efflux transporter outer membrane subunit [Aquimonas sp.]|jgi:multidrug efflux system outer membrane protein|uniref:efflux transporter outer membrane subunit n=1 Tax=Aquimonas sp. TaxID=1872588 RepID=UPI0037BE527C
MFKHPLALAFAMAFTLGACTVGPEYVRPAAELPERFDQSGVTASTEAVQPALWRAFNDPALDSLITRALLANTGLAQALARLDETRALAGLSTYSLMPTVGIGVDGERSQPSGRDPFIPSDQGRTDTYRAGFDASWEIDLFGSLRNPKRAIFRRVEADAAALEHVHISVVAEVAQALFELRGAHARLRLIETNLQGWSRSVDLISTLERNGRRTGLDVARARAQRSSLAADFATAEAAVGRSEQRLAVLTAQPVAAVRSLVDAETGLPQLPSLTAVGTPEEWLKRRPDVREAERRLAVAYADIGTQTAEYFPKLTLLGGFGWTAQGVGELGEGSSERWRWGPSISWSILDFGRTRQRVRAAEARADGAEALFQETLLRALEETENALAGYRAANRSAFDLAEAAEAAGEAARLANLRFEAGSDDALTLLDAERTRVDFELRSVDALVARATSLAALYKALAGDFAQAAAAPES